ncbi:MAG: hydroxymethylbilane synthase [Atribacterota bacterium]
MKDQRVIRVGSRGSVLALRQTQEVVERLSRVYQEVQWEVVPITTTGDRFPEDPKTTFAKGMFVKEVEEALLRGIVDLAVHSLKDLPVDLPPGLAIFAVLKREDPRDVLLSRKGLPFAALPRGATIGTSSVRRKVQIEALRPDLEVVPLRGNVPTRIRKMERGEVDALVLAAAGLKRLGEEARIVEYFSPEVLVPAVGQGVIVVEGRAKDPLESMVTVLNHKETAQAVEIERNFLRLFGGGCQIPVGALAVVENGWIRLFGMAAYGKEVKKVSLEGPVEEQSSLVQSLVRLLRGDGHE